MIENTEAQERLHPELVSRDAHRVIEIAKEHGALGWKVNGAGGEGGLAHHSYRHTFTCETGDDTRNRSREQALQKYPHLSQPLWAPDVGEVRRRQRAIGRRDFLALQSGATLIQK